MGVTVRAGGAGIMHLHGTSHVMSGDISMALGSGRLGLGPA